MISVVFHWLLTYLLHSTVLLTCAALLDWRRRFTARGLGSPLWRIALFGGFVSASLQPAFQLFGAPLPDFQPLPAQGFSHMPMPSVALPPLQADVIDLAPLLVPLWLGAAALGLAYLLLRWVQVARLAARMPPVSSRALVRSARELSAAARTAMPALRVAPHWQAPLVAPGRIVCVPAWMLDGYEPARLKAALAHEIAHLRRHDNAWRIASRIAALAGWLQPLNLLATKRLDESAELACDAWAAAATGLGHELACSLEDCALRLGVLRPGMAPAAPLLTIGMAASRSTLLERVTKLVEDAHVNTALKRTARWSSAVLLAIAAAGVFFVVSTLDDDVPPRWLAANGLYQSLRNAGKHVQRSRSVVVRSPEQYVYVLVTEDFSIDPGSTAKGQAGMAVIAETRAGVTRSVRYDRSASGLKLTYRVNGRIQSLDAAAEQWLGKMLPIAAPAFGRT